MLTASTSSAATPMAVPSWAPVLRTPLEVPLRVSATSVPIAVPATEAMPRRPTP
jgi:hypothetical protein